MELRHEAAPGLSTEERLDHETLDWGEVRASTFVLQQRIRYEYPGPIRDLRHRLMVVPPLRHGDQRRVAWRVDVSGADARIRDRRDRFGNLALDVRARRVPACIEFDVETIVARRDRNSGTLSGVALVARRWLEPSSLTAPDANLRRAARDLSADGCRGLELARRITGWTHTALTYADGVTTVHTTAGEALAVGRGVCQDYAHVMLALCRLCDLPARYVSGHLLGEGGSHAWVEVLVPAPDRPDRAWAVPFDATHDRSPGLSYLTVAVGRDYADVAPTSGTYEAPFGGTLSVTKRLGLASVEQTTGR